MNLECIAEEDSGDNQTDEQPQFKVAENYPLRLQRPHAEVLLINYSEIKDTLEQKVGFKCEECFRQDTAITAIKKAIKKKKDQRVSKFYKYIILDMDDQSVELEKFGIKI